MFDIVTFGEYETAQNRTRNHDLPIEEALKNFALGLAGEAGEVADLIKKWLYHGHPQDRTRLLKELGDALWYLTAIAYEVDSSLREVAEMNVDKLKARYPNGFSTEASLNRVAED